MAEKKKKPLLDPEWEYNQTVKREELYRDNAGKRLAGELWDKVMEVVSRIKKKSSASPSNETSSGTLPEFGDVAFGNKARPKKSAQYKRMKQAVEIAKRRRGQ
ncbi:MAG: hypothetical protein WC097_00685 [Eubacteriales bacterium]